MQELCAAFGTLSRWDPEQQLLEIGERTAAMDFVQRP